MFQWAAMLVMMGAAAGCLFAMGAGSPRVAELLAVLLLMTCVAALIAYPFLRKRTPP